MITGRISARAWSPVLWLDVVSLGARIVAVVDPRAGEVRVEWGNLRHLHLTSSSIFVVFTVPVGSTFRRREILTFRYSPVNGQLPRVIHNFPGVTPPVVSCSLRML